MYAPDRCDISRWLSEINKTSSTSLASLRRKRLHTPEELTPPASFHGIVMENESGPVTPSRKKRRMDAEATPTRPVLPSDSASQASNDLSSVRSRDSPSRISSRNSSPTKQFLRLQIHNPLNIHFDEFDTTTHPSSLQNSRQCFSSYGFNLKIIPSKDRDTALKLATSSIPTTDASFYDDQEPHRYGPMPAADSISIVQADSHYCKANYASESMWNLEVHAQVLRLALRGEGVGMRAGLVNFTYCTSAAIHSHLYKSGKRTQSKMIDFCLYIDSDVVGQHDPAAQAAILRLSETSRSAAVNHTAFVALRNHPIALAIESKRQDGSFDAATLQVGTWQAAQWKFLSNLLRENNLDINTLEYLPGLIVQGPEWFFVASTRQDGGTTLWTKQSIGSTTSVIGTYKVIRAIQHLAAWCAEEYWPWFRANVLDLDEAEPALVEPT